MNGIKSFSNSTNNLMNWLLFSEMKPVTQKENFEMYEALSAFVKSVDRFVNYCRIIYVCCITSKKIWSESITTTKWSSMWISLT